jgi:pimeloyl-ACP methyl ester carboxylesterase
LSTNNLKTNKLTNGRIEITRTILIDHFAKDTDGSRLLNFKNYEVHVRSNPPNGKPVLLGLHGICDSLHTWDPWSEELEKHFHFIRIDLPFFGLTKKDDSLSLTEDYYNLFLDELIKELKIEKFNLLGHSLGAFFSWNYAIHNPLAVEKLILLAPPGYPQTPPKIVTLATNEIIQRLALLWIPKLVIKPILLNLFFSKEHIKQNLIDRYYYMLMCEGNKREYSKIFNFVMKFAGQEHKDMDKISQPTLILWGKEDLWVPSTHAAPYFQEKIPHAKIILYEEMRHMPQYERTKETLNELLLFFELPDVN